MIDVHHLNTVLRELPLKTRLRVLEGVSDDMVIEDAHGVRFSCRSVVEWRRLRKAKPWNAAISTWIEGFGPGDAFYDIGANVGVFALLAGLRHAAAVPVIAFEPAADTFEALTRNILVNHLESAVTPLQVALHATTGLQPFHYQARGAGAAGHAVGDPIDQRRRSFTPAASLPVMAFALDDLVEQLHLPPPTRVKIDVDGTEAQVLRGAVRTLTRGPCELWIEVTDGGLTTQLAALGFAEVGRQPHADYGICDVLFRRR